MEISAKLQSLFLLSIPLFILHGLEEYFTGFYLEDPIFKLVFGPVLSMGTAQASFLVFQVMIWALLLVSYAVLARSKPLHGLLVFLGLVFIFEFHHLVEAILAGSYYSGVVTGTLLPIVGIFYWKELIRCWK